jgi:hypothetical protein
MEVADQLAPADGIQQDVADNAVDSLLQDKMLDTGFSATGKKIATKPVVLLTQTRMTPDGSAQWKASLMQSNSDSGLLNKTKALCGGAVSPVRASKRNTSTSKQD